MGHSARGGWIIAAGIVLAASPACKKDAPAPKASAPSAPAGEREARGEPASAGAPTPTGELASPTPEGASASAAPPGVAGPGSGKPSEARGPTFIVASDTAILEVAPDGTTVRTLREGAARWPRRLPGGAGILFLVPETGELRRIGADGAGEALVARLPDLLGSCQASDGTDPVQLRRSELAVQSEADFAIATAGDVACLRLADRNENMAEQTVELRIELATGALSARVTLPDDCGPPSDAPACAWPTRAPLPAPPAHPFDIVDGKLVRRSAGETTVVSALGRADDFSVDARSPSGRWVAVSGLISEGDYIHRSLFLLDADGGMLRPVQPGAWPDPLPLAGLAALESETVETAGVVGESTIAWTGDEVLRVDGLLIQPEKGGVQLEGDVAP